MSIVLKTRKGLVEGLRPGFLNWYTISLVTVAQKVAHLAVIQEDPSSNLATTKILIMKRSQ